MSKNVGEEIKALMKKKKFSSQEQNPPLKKQAYYYTLKPISRDTF